MAARPRPRQDYLDQLETLEPAPLLDADIEEFLREVDRRLMPHLRKALGRVPQVEPLRRGMTHQITSGGKRIRAALCAASCELFGTGYERGLPFAAAIEHMQNFTLVHDDISDGDEYRRAQQSIWKQFGVPHGINIGDTFIPLAALEILDSPYADELKLRLLKFVAELGLAMVEGQTLDLNMRTRRDVSEQHYLECTQKKTGAFLAMATVGGGAIGGATDEQLGTLRQFALQAGVAFQIKDDLLDLDGTKGRAIGSDVLEGKRTLLVIYAARECSELERKHLFSILDKPRERNGSREVQWVFDLYARTRAREYAESTATRLIDDACGHLLALPESAAKYRLLRLSRYLSGRSH
jgi:geranylgeranyl diphosphate synthase type I